MFQHWIGQEKTSLSVHNYSCCCHVCLASQYPAGRPAWRCSVKCWTQNSVLFFDFSHLILFCYCSIWVQLKPPPNCLCFISQLEACKKYFKQLSCGLFLKCHVTPKVILCYFDYSEKMRKEVGWTERNSNWNSTPSQASGVGTLLIFGILEISKAVWILKNLFCQWQSKW